MSFLDLMHVNLLKETFLLFAARHAVQFQLYQLIIITKFLFQVGASLIHPTLLVFHASLFVSGVVDTVRFSSNPWAVVVFPLLLHISVTLPFSSFLPKKKFHLNFDLSKTSNISQNWTLSLDLARAKNF